MDFFNIYHHEIPQFIDLMSKTKEMERLKGVGMDCGCEYTSFPQFQNEISANRYDHSIGVALIVYHFTNDCKQAVSGLFHDIASPVFSHVIDFVNKDYLKQESTEEYTAKIISESQEIQALLGK